MSDENIGREEKWKEINKNEEQPSMDKVTKSEWKELTDHTYKILQIEAQGDIEGHENFKDAMEEYKKDIVYPVIERILSYQGTSIDEESDLARNIYERALSHSQHEFSEEMSNAVQPPLWRRILLKIF